MALFAVIENGSHQFRVQSGQTITIDLRKEVKPGDSISFERILAAGNNTDAAVGRPLVDGASVTGEVIDPVKRGPKIEVGKFRRRKSYIRHTGHVQRYTTVKITGISVPGLVEDAAPAPVAETPAPETPATETPAS